RRTSQVARGVPRAAARDRRDPGRGPAVCRPRASLGYLLRRMGSGMVQRAVAEAGRGDAGTELTGTEPTATELTRPSFVSVLRQGLPGFLREGFLPLAAFYAGIRMSGLAAGIAAAGVASLAIYGFERAAGRDGLLVRLSLLFVAVQTAVGLGTHSAVAYLAAPVLLNAAWGLAFLGSVAIGRPLAGALACAWYPFPHDFPTTPQFRHVFGVE